MKDFKEQIVTKNGVKMLIIEYADGTTEERPFEEGRTSMNGGATQPDPWQTATWKAKTSMPIGLGDDGTPFTEEDVEAMLAVLEYPPSRSNG